MNAPHNILRPMESAPKNGECHGHCFYMLKNPKGWLPA